MKNYKLNIEDKKELVNRLEELTGIKPKYTFMPRCAYEIGAFTVGRRGDLTIEENTDEDIIQTLINEGMITEARITEEVYTPAEDTMEETMQENTEDAGVEMDEEGELDAVDSMTISLPMTGHTADSLRRMVNLLYSRGKLLSKATCGAFGVTKDLIAALDEAGTIVKAEDFITIVNEHGGMTGLTFADGKVNFTGFPMTDDPDKAKAFMQLVSLMNRHALEMKRIQAKEVNDDNEKYAFRIWLLRIGMNSDEYKTARKLLMENLSGHAAFRTKAEEEKWKANQKAKREELKAAKAAPQTAEAGEENEDE